jgi:hypothetical protein
MNKLLSRLGVPPEIQSHFRVSPDLRFPYGQDEEHFGENFHKVPTTRNLWVAGSPQAGHVVVLHSAIEAIALVTLKRHRFLRLETAAFAAIGNRLYRAQGDYLRKQFPERKFTLAFGNDLLGRLTAVKMAALIRDFPLRLVFSGNAVRVSSANSTIVYTADRLSLHAVQEDFGLRPRFRTAAPSGALTFLDQLKYAVK